MGILRRERTRAWLALSLAAGLCVVHSFVDIDWDFIAVQGPLFLTVGALVRGPGPSPVAAAVPARRWLVSAIVGVCALAALYSLASPWLSANRVDAAYDAIVRGNLPQARTEARSAHAFNPLSVDALLVQASVEPDRKALQLYNRRATSSRRIRRPGTSLARSSCQVGLPRAAYHDLNQSYTLDSYGPAGVKGGPLDQARCKIDPATCPK